MHKEPEGTCRTCASAAETARKAAAYDGLTRRVAVLEAELGRYSMQAGEADQFRGEALACRKALGFPVDGEGDDAASPHDITTRVAELERERDAATARAEALAQALRDIRDHGGDALPGFDGGECGGAKGQQDRRTCECCDCETERDRDMDRAECGCCDRAMERARRALTGTPPADLTQHPAYRAGVEKSTRASAEVARRTEIRVRRAIRQRDQARARIVVTRKAARLEGFAAGFLAGISHAKEHAEISTWDGWHEHSPRVDWTLVERHKDGALKALLKTEAK